MLSTASLAEIFQGYSKSARVLNEQEKNLLKSIKETFREINTMPHVTLALYEALVNGETAAYIEFPKEDIEGEFSDIDEVDFLRGQSKTIAEDLKSMGLRVRACLSTRDEEGHPTYDEKKIRYLIVARWPE